MDATLLGLLGTAFSAFIAAVGYYAKSRHDRLRTTRIVLYYLLELHHKVARARFAALSLPKEYFELCVQAFKRRGICVADLDQQQLLAELGRITRNTVVLELEGLSTEIVEPYTQSLAELAKDEPLLAYRLRGKESLTRISEFIRRCVAGLPLTTIDTTKQAHEAFLQDADDFARNVMLSELNSAIRMVSIRCGLLTYFRCRLLIWRESQLSLSKIPDPNVLQFVDSVVQKSIDYSNGSTSPAQAVNVDVTLTP